MQLNLSGSESSQGTDLSNVSVTDAPLGGSLEMNVHSALHFWTGDPNKPLRQHMGVFTHASQDPIFYAHHSDIDRLWEVWRTLPGGCRKESTDEDFLEAEFLFYDENKNLVKVKAKESLDLGKMGVSYEPATEGDDLWKNFQPRPMPGNEGSQVEYAKKMGATEIAEATVTSPAIELGSNFSALVKLPSKLTNTCGETGSSDKQELVEILMIQGVSMGREDYVHLKVFVNMPTATEATLISSAEYVGAANIVPSPQTGKRLFSNVKLEIGDNLERLGLQGEEYVVLTAILGTF